MFASLLDRLCGDILPEFAWEQSGFRFFYRYRMHGVLVAQHSEAETVFRRVLDANTSVPWA